MATLASIIGGTFLGNIFPELRWKELDSADYAEIFTELALPGSILSATLDTLKKRRVKFGFLPQAYSGGGWTLLHNISIATGTNLADRYTVSLIIHEVFHLGQPFLTRLSVHGELLAWQHQQQGYQEAFGREIGEAGEAYPGTQTQWDALSRLSAGSRADLEQARTLMQSIAQHYRSDCLPLFPLPTELWLHLRHLDFRGAFEAIKNLVTCRG